MRIVKISNGRLLLRDIDRHIEKVASEAEVLRALHSGVLVTQADALDQEAKQVLDSAQQVALRGRFVTDKALAVMLTKVKWLRALREAGVTDLRDCPALRQIMSRLHLTEMKGAAWLQPATLRDAQRRLDASGADPLTLLPMYEARGGRSQTRLDRAVENIISDVIILFREDKSRKLFVRHIDEEIRARVLEAKAAAPAMTLRMPGYSTIGRRVHREFSAFEIHVRNHGHKAAIRRFRENAIRIVAERPLEVAEADDTDASVFLIDHITGLPFGRAFLTSSVDQSTEMPLGANLSHHYRDSASATDCILNGLCPKDVTLDEFAGLNKPWLGYGQPGITLLDNATYNHSQITQSAIHRVGQVAALAKPFAATEKSVIETFNKRVKEGLVSRLAGSKGRKGDTEALKRGEASAIYTVRDFKQAYARWVTEEHVYQPRADGRSIRERWEQFFSDHRPTVRWSREQIKFFRMVPREIRFRESGGLLVHQLRYGGPAVEALRRTLGATASVTVFVDPNDLTYVLVQHPHSHALLHAACLEDPRYTVGLTLRQQRLILSMCREMKRLNPDMVDLIAGRTKLHVLTEQQRRSNKLRIRQRGTLNHVHLVPLEATSDSATDAALRRRAKKEASEQVAVTDLEYSIAQLDLASLEAEATWTL